MRFRKSVAFLAVLMIMLVGASVHADVNPTGFPIVDEPITLEMMGRRSPIQPAWEEMILPGDGRAHQYPLEFRTSGR